MVDARAPSRSAPVDAVGSRMPAIPHTPDQPAVDVACEVRTADPLP